MFKLKLKASLELKYTVCPFCGAEIRLLSVQGLKDASIKKYYIAHAKLSNCGIFPSTKLFTDKSLLIFRWNNLLKVMQEVERLNDEE